MKLSASFHKLDSWRRRAGFRKLSTFELCTALFLVALSIFMLLPIVYIINHAFKPYQELFIYPPNIFVREPSLQNFAELLATTKGTAVPVSRYLFNSVIVTSMAVFLITMTSAMCAYAISKHKFPGYKLVFGTILLTLVFVPETVEIPKYLIVSKLHIFDTYWGHVLPLVAVPTGVFLMKQFIDQLPDELLDSAKMDGAKELRLFISIVMPMLMPAVATIAIIAFDSAWKDSSTSTSYMQNEAMKTFPFYVETLTSGMANSVARQGAAAAAALLLFLPNLIMFLVFQSKVIATMAHSGIK
ncbi:carbohydrate ABC transporter permease [Paenibacillus sp. GCM10023248]|uniref:carbohydrate ABC transporter permease n=1 Tax=Bacillales TaxID=1385 RepID=UPI002379F35C|nr:MULTISPECIES: carbohydrate ABC transporter permease [Bacillales]MDD9269180.1 carbohydrate ABC transporter permease [Paenibacillus sp. MAHUQ-63]MDR6880600.1 ABC-type glycerol-3-phosphate transport system permease component [Bacillus sp. 3255]